MRWMSGEGGSGAYFKCKYAMNKENRKLNSAIVLTKKRKGRQTSNTARGVLVGIWFRHEVFLFSVQRNPRERILMCMRVLRTKCVLCVVVAVI